MTKLEHLALGLEAKKDKDLTKLLDLFPVPVIVHQSGVIKYLNPAAIRLFKASKPEDVVGRLVSDFTLPEDNERIPERLKHIREHGVSQETFNFRLKDLKGHISQVTSNSGRIIWDGEEAFMVIAQNMSESQMIKSEPQAKTILLERIPQTVPDVMYIIDRSEQRYIFTKGNVFDLIGMKPPEDLTLAVKEFKDRLHPDEKQVAIDFRRAVDNLSSVDEFVEVEYRLKGADGKYRWLNHRTTLFEKANNGEGDKIFSIIKDITEKRVIEEELKEKNLFIEKITQSIPDIVYVTDSILQKNVFLKGSYLKVLGYDRVERNREDIEFLKNLIHPDDQGKQRAVSDKLRHLGQDEFVSAEYRIQAADGSWKWFFNRVSVFKRNEQGVPTHFFGIGQDITERENIERELLENQLFIEKITESIPDIVYVADIASGTNAYQKGSYLQSLGYGINEAESKENLDFLRTLVHPEDIEHVRRTVDRLRSLGEGEFVKTEYRLKAKDGNWKWFYNRSMVFKRDDEGNPIQYFGVGQDITDRKEKEALIRRNEEIYRNIAKNIPNGSVTVFDRDLRFIIIEGPLAERQGLKKSDVEGKSARESLPDGINWKTLVPYFERVIEGEEFTLEFPQNEYLFRITLVPLRDEQGNIIGGLNITQDIYEIRKTQESLEASEETRKAILDAIPDLVFRVDREGRFLDFYPSSELEPGLPTDEFIGQSVSDVFEKELAIRFSQYLAWAIEDKSVQTFEYEITEPDDQRFFEGRISPISDNQAIIIIRDITEIFTTRSELDKKVIELSEKNQELEKYITSNTELEKFAYIASHDLKEPLRTIIGFSQLLEKQFGEELGEAGSDYIEHIIAGTKRMKTLIDGLLEYSRVESKGRSFRLTEFNELIKRILADLKNAIEENNVQINISRLPILMCDELQIRQLLQNLISNSIKFQSDKPLKINIMAEEEDEFWVFSVQDNGIGMDMRYADKIFQIFQRLHTQDKYPGSGIGLSICKRIVDRHGGRIWVESEPGQGTTFYFTLPKNI
jgi:PAS domain S-box-containing protein